MPPQGMLTSLQGYPEDVYSVAWSPDGKTLASGSRDRELDSGSPPRANCWPVGRDILALFTALRGVRTARPWPPALVTRQ